MPKTSRGGNQRCLTIQTTQEDSARKKRSGSASDKSANDKNANDKNANDKNANDKNASDRNANVNGNSRSSAVSRRAPPYLGTLTRTIEP
jgi:hypothetical protein